MLSAAVLVRYVDNILLVANKGPFALLPMCLYIFRGIHTSSNFIDFKWYYISILLCVCVCACVRACVHACACSQVVINEALPGFFVGILCALTGERSLVSVTSKVNSSVLTINKTHFYR